MSKRHFKPNPCNFARSGSKFTSNRFEVTCKFCLIKNNILPDIMEELEDKTFGIMSAVEDDLGFVFERAKVWFIEKVRNDPTKNYHPWDTETLRELIEYFDEEYQEVKEAFENNKTTEDKQGELLDIILTSSFIYLKLKAREKELKERSFMGK